MMPLQLTLVVLVCLAALPARLCADNVSTTSTQSIMSAAPRLNVRDFGAKGDSASDDRSAFQSALDACAKSGGIVFVPAGRYMIRGHLRVPDYVTLEGVFSSPPTRTDSKGSTLLAVEGKGNEFAEPFITLFRNATLKGLQVFYPEQTETIVPYPWTVRGVGDNCSIIDVLLVNPYMAVDFGTFNAGRHYIRGLYAQALKTGLFIDKCFDVGRVEDVHFWPFWTEKVMDWTAEHGTAFVIGKTDWEYMTNCFAISYATGYHFIEGAAGPGNAVLTNCGSDVGPLAVKVDSVQSHAGVSFVNGQFMAGVEIADTNCGPVKFTSCGFWGVSGKTNTHAVIRGSGQATFAACHFAQWGLADSAAPCIKGVSGALIINGCEFLDTEPGKSHIQLMEDVESAIITSNRFRSAPKFINHSQGDVAISNNTGGRKPLLLDAIQREDAAGVSAAWRERLHRGTMENQSVVTRLASAQIIAGRSKGLRKQLLESIAREDAADSATATFIVRAKDELNLDRACLPQSRPEIVAMRGNVKQPATSFPSTGNADRTEISLRWDDQYLHVSARMVEPLIDKLRAVETKHDGKIWTDDNLEVFISPGRVTHRYLQLIVNSAGVWYDGTGTDRTTSSSDWDATPEIETGREDGAWICEMKISWSDIGRKPPRPGDVWGLDLRRWRYTTGHLIHTSWAKAPLQGNTHHPEAFGFVRFEK